ncbi:hypothetical protein CC80DRAFT_236420 [Byssothecium circinans]|uniref:Uncharacterized protein n=1 Tax=Byssothecium circinans TaxID=147558 RepID=A0A6A5U9I6_9PLEO|nr:hypothetical protein CC80DRAFT_236420 [Byssothecium circinans]
MAGLRSRKRVMAHRRLKRQMLTCPSVAPRLSIKDRPFQSCNLPATPASIPRTSNRPPSPTWGVETAVRREGLFHLSCPARSTSAQNSNLNSRGTVHLRALKLMGSCISLSLPLYSTAYMHHSYPSIPRLDLASPLILPHPGLYILHPRTFGVSTSAQVTAAAIPSAQLSIFCMQTNSTALYCSPPPNCPIPLAGHAV